MKSTGAVTKWNDEKGYGFVRDAKTAEEVFFHISEVKQNWLRPKIGSRLSYVVMVDEKGKKRASDVEITNAKMTESGAGKAFIFLLVVFALLGGAVLLKKLPLIIFYAFAIMSVLTFVYYWFDKWCAKTERRRVPESTLHLLSLLFGWPGANFAQQLLRHKSIKKEFRIAFYVMAILNVVFVGFLLHPKGAWLNAQLVELGAMLNSSLKQLLNA